MDFMDRMRVKLVDAMRQEQQDRARAREPKFIGYHNTLLSIFVGD
jgi:muconolactone delta-isomerase